MKQLFFSLSLILLFFGCSEKPGYNISGEIAKERTDVNGKQVYLMALNETRDFLDSCLVENNQFRFQDETPLDQLCLITLNEERAYSPGFTPAFVAQIMVEQGKMKVVLDTVSYVTGTEENDRYTKLQDQSIKIREEYEAVAQELIEGDDAHNEKVKERLGLLYDGFLTEVKTYIIDNITTLSAKSVFKSWGSAFSLEQQEEILAKADDTFKADPEISGIITIIELQKKTAVGQPFIDFEMADQNGKMKRLSDYIGKDKYVFLDFWASWCGPCIRELPHVTAAYKKYKGKAFEIVAVSLDQDKDKWLEAIKNHKMEWIHLSDLKGWSCEGAQLYGVRSIPTTLLIDKDGIIIDKNLRGEALDKKLAELLD